MTGPAHSPPQSIYRYVTVGGASAPAGEGRGPAEGVRGLLRGASFAAEPFEGPTSSLRPKGAYLLATKELHAKREAYSDAAPAHSQFHRVAVRVHAAGPRGGDGRRPEEGAAGPTRTSAESQLKPKAAAAAAFASKQNEILLFPHARTHATNKNRVLQ